MSIVEPPAFGRCLEFWYHQYGNDIGQLNVYIELNSTGVASRTLVWSRGANIGNVWRKAHVPTEYTESFRVIFEGVVGKGHEVRQSAVRAFVFIESLFLTGRHRSGRYQSFSSLV